MGQPRKKPIVVDGVECWVCLACKEIKPAERFCKHKRRHNGLNSICKDCQKIQNDAYRANPEGLKKARACARRWNAANSERYRANIKRARTENKAARVVYEKAYDKANPEKRLAKRAVQTAVQQGRLSKPKACEVCESSRPLDAHHDSYDRDRWLVVVWMCKRCHRWTHMRWTDQSNGIW